MPNDKIEEGPSYASMINMTRDQNMVKRPQSARKKLEPIESNDLDEIISVQISQPEK